MLLSLTYIQYYLGGLTAAQLESVFRALQRLSESEAKAIYRRWMESVPATEKDGFAEFNGVNLEDSFTFEERIWPTLRYHTGVVDFWLQRLILPVQAKQFPKKLLSNAADLCRDSTLLAEWKAVTTGFSGTDDLSLVLPETVRQQNLRTLEMTNGIQLRNLLRPENNEYICPDTDAGLCEESGASATAANSTLVLLAYLKRRKDISVVLDAGGLILHYKDNEAFARAWLAERDRDTEAVVFFRGDKTYVVRQRAPSHARPVPLSSTPYAEDLSKCIIYLDDVHTRGSDFRLPLTTRGLLTLGKGMPKDKLLQACMRLRQLGHGQSLTFAASREVDLALQRHYFPAALRLLGSDSEREKISGVLSWAISNTVMQICDLFPYLVNQARSSLRKAIAFKTKKQEGPASLAAEVVEDEVLQLADLYGHDRDVATLADIARHQLARFLPEPRSQVSSKRMSPASGGLTPRTTASTPEVASSPEEDDGACRRLTPRGNSCGTTVVAAAIVARVERLVPNVRRPCNMFDEEQERELEAELEEETQVERPPPASPAEAEVSHELRTLLESHAMSESAGFPSAGALLNDTSLRRTPLRDCLYQGTFDPSLADVRSIISSYSKVVFTTDFLRTVTGCSTAHKDDYLKRIRFIVRVERGAVHGSSPEFLVVVSNFEAEHYAHLLRSSLREPNPKFNLYAFAALTRLQQPRRCLTMSGIDVPPLVHLLAGSIHVDPELLGEVAAYLGLVPRSPPQEGNTEQWDLLFSTGLIQRDGFVVPGARSSVGGTLGLREKLSDSSCPFASSVVGFVHRFLADSRHLAEDLSTSPVGKLLGVSEVQGCD
ncbi:unnamed protein product [Amoebophrya sp. A120]|nr:unnamed protein product [Amoebophrya sp. A120]|eukprot:GSA120T00005220001.1